MPDDQNSQLVGSFIPTTNIWDVGNLNDIDVNSPEFKELIIRLYQNINLISIVMNTKDTGYYNLDEFVCGQVYFPNPIANSPDSDADQFRQVFRIVVNFGALPNTAAKVVAHGITTSSRTLFTRIYACASDTTGQNYIPIPYASPTLANNIELSVNNTNVTITTGSDRTNFNNCTVVLEYVQY